jgi:hypothetical protein
MGSDPLPRRVSACRGMPQSAVAAVAAASTLWASKNHQKALEKAIVYPLKKAKMSKGPRLACLGVILLSLIYYFL